ncbi:MAG: hypothetical protein JW816_02550 [Candidatus Buchananbacteria bacterium]|nr:hypothetical protein [Candidatus Buchananbacteria bacterium]
MKNNSFIIPRFYRNFAIVFLVLAIIFLCSVAYLIWANVTIIITPAQELKDYNLAFAVSDATTTPAGLVPGKIQQVSVSDQQIFQATGQESISKDSGIVGNVIFINNYSKDQALVATTRLADKNNPDQVLVRLKSSVTVPAGGRVEATVYTDDPDNFKDIKPQDFIIPGLWQPLQDKIYAQSSQTLSAAGQVVSVVSDQDLNQSKQTLQTSLSQKAMSQIDTELSAQQALWPKLVDSSGGQFNPSAKSGDQVSDFQASMDLTARVVAFDEQKVIDLAQAKLAEQNISSMAINPNNFDYKLESINPDQNQAQVSLTFKAAAATDFSNQDSFDKSQLFGKTADEVQAYFSQFPDVSSVQVVFSPSWLKKLPRLADKIKIQIAD